MGESSVFSMSHGLRQRGGRLREQPLHRRVIVRCVNAPSEFRRLQEFIRVTLLKLGETPTSAAMLDEHEPAGRAVGADGKEGQRNVGLHRGQRFAHGEPARQQLHAEGLCRLAEPLARRTRRRGRNVDLRLTQGTRRLGFIKRHADGASQALQDGQVRHGRR